MRISTVSVKNFRSLKDVTVNLDPYTCLVGPNGSGKSAIIKALNLFFHQNPEGLGSGTTITSEDYHLRNTANPIRVEIVFTDLSATAQHDFKHYVRDGQLRVFTEITFDPSTGTGLPKQHGIRPGMEDFRQFFIAEKNKTSVAGLRSIFESLRETYPDIPTARTKAAMIDSLQSFESDRPELCTDMESEDEFYGVSRGKNLLDRHIQWVYIPAVKDASSEETESRSSALGSLLQRTVRASVDFSDEVANLRDDARTQFQAMLDRHQSTLDDLSSRLGDRIAMWAHPDASLRVRWHEDPDRSVRVDSPYAAILAQEGSFEGQIGRFGHGFQRSFLLSLLQELASLSDTGPTLVLACEEPELYQHPPQARYLASLLRDLASNGDQMLVTTHDPNFVTADQPEAVRLCRIDRSMSSTRIVHTSASDIAEVYGKVVGKQAEAVTGSKAKIFASLQLSISEIFFARRVILVEGYEDLAYIETYLNLINLKDEFRSLGCHIVPCHGKNHMIRPLVVCKQLDIPVVVVFDTDADKLDSLDKHGWTAMHRRDNLAILRLCNAAKHSPFPKRTIWEQSVVGWSSDIGEVVRSDMGQGQWDEIRTACEANFGLVGGLKKNPIFVAEVITQAWDRGLRSKNLDRLCRLIAGPDLSLI